MPTRLLVKEHNSVVDHPADQLSELRGAHPCWLDISNPQSEDFDLVAKELELHPLAVEDARHGHQRPKIDQYESHYFIVFYALEAPSPGVVNYHQVATFAAPNGLLPGDEGALSAARLVNNASAQH